METFKTNRMTRKKAESVFSDICANFVENTFVEIAEKRLVNIPEY
jgi:hypothetical protein